MTTLTLVLLAELRSQGIAKNLKTEIKPSKKYLPNFPTQKSRYRKFQPPTPPKNPSIVASLEIPRPPPPPPPPPPPSLSQPTPLHGASTWKSTFQFRSPIWSADNRCFVTLDRCEYCKALDWICCHWLDIAVFMLKIH